MDDQRFPWLVLVPRRLSVSEIEQLPAAERAQLMEEGVAAGAAVRAIGAALGRPVEKLNLGALGNVTPQLHLHVVGRRRDDDAWPGPVWGVGERLPHAAGTLDIARRAGRAALSLP